MPLPIPSEAAVLAQCRDFLRLCGAVVVRVNSGGTPAEYKGRKRWIRYNDTPGVSDLLACLMDPATGRGRFIAVECKRPGGRVSPAQRAFLDGVTRAGGLALIISDVRDLEAALRMEGVIG